MAAHRSRRWRQSLSPTQLDLSIDDKLAPSQRTILRFAEITAQLLGIIAVVLRHGLYRLSPTHSMELGAVVVSTIFILTATFVVRYRASLTPDTFRRDKKLAIFSFVLWYLGCAAILILGMKRIGIAPDATRLQAVFVWADIFIVVGGVFRTLRITRQLASGTFSPALILVLSFASLITVGTLLLMLPKCRAESAPQHPFIDHARICLFTATSASCVTGLVVVDTGGDEAYWSRTGQVVILCLFQIGGLGIMTFGAMFAIASGAGMRLRETATLREMFDSEHPINVQRLLFAIVAFGFGSELVGAILMSGHWPDLPLGERLFFGLFHSVSAFCNAGFDLTGNSFYGQATAWRVWGVISTLVVLGGIGFGVMYNIAHVVYSKFFPRRATPLVSHIAYRTRFQEYRPERLLVTTRLILITTVALNVIGTSWIFFFEATSEGSLTKVPLVERLADAWFQSVSFRTAGFNTIDLSALHPGTKMLTIVLMFIGGSPVSTAGGIKTATLAVTVLSVYSLMRGRPKTEVFGRTLPDDITRRALAVLTIGGAVVLSTTLLLTVFEDTKHIQELDLMFEAVSACGTVGVSTGITPGLSGPSQLVLIVAMFLGRVGPLTILLGLAGVRPVASYSYPEERVTLG